MKFNHNISKNMVKIAAFTLLFFSMAKAQNEVDAYRFSGMQLYGTARAMGMGGAFSAVGADFSATSLNPAGLGVYRRSELEFTPSFRSARTESEMLNASQEESRVNLGISNLGYVYYGERQAFNTDSRRTESKTSGFKSFGLGIGYNQIANFSRNTDVTGFNAQSSITDYFAAQANGTNVNDLYDQRSYAAMAFDAYMIDTASGSLTDYFGAAQGGQINQRYRAAETGRINEWNIAFGGNYNDKVYFGAALGIQNLKYNQTLDFVETDDNNVHNTWAGDSIPFEYLILTDQYSTRGSGFNFKVGMIFRPVDFIRIGISAQTPTALTLRDEYNSSITGKVDTDSGELGNDPLTGSYSYKLRTPYKVTGGIMALIKKAGFISADVELTDYTNSKFRSTVGLANPGYYSFADENSAITNSFATAVNYRVGGEARIGMMRLRAGYANYGSVLGSFLLRKTDFETGNQQNYSGKKQYLTAGFGYKSESFYLDFAFVNGLSQDNITTYSYYAASGVAPELHRKNHSNNFILTTGFTF